MNIRLTILTLTVSLLTAGLFFGCHKSNDTTVADGPTAYLTAAAWHLKAFRYDLGINGTTDYTIAPDSCETDDSYTFSADNILSFSPGTRRCSTLETATTTTWSFTGGGGRLSYGVDAYNIGRLCDSVLTLYYDTTENNITYRAYIDFRH